MLPLYFTQSGINPKQLRAKTPESKKENSSPKTSWNLKDLLEKVIQLLTWSRLPGFLQVMSWNLWRFGFVKKYYNKVRFSIKGRRKKKKLSFTGRASHEVSHPFSLLLSPPPAFLGAADLEVTCTFFISALPTQAGRADWQAGSRGSCRSTPSAYLPSRLPQRAAGRVTRRGWHCGAEVMWSLGEGS